GRFPVGELVEHLARLLRNRLREEAVEALALRLPERRVERLRDRAVVDLRADLLTERALGLRRLEVEGAERPPEELVEVELLRVRLLRERRREREHEVD